MLVSDKLWKEFCTWAETEEAKPDVAFSVAQSSGALRAFSYQANRIVKLEAALAARETQATNQSRRIEELAELCEEKDKALADLKPGAEAWKLMREHHYSLNWDDGASPTFRGWEVCKSCDENGWLVKAVSDPVTAVLAAKAVKEKR